MRTRISYTSLREIMGEKCPPEHFGLLWRMYRHGYTGVAPIGEAIPANGTRLYIHGGYISAEELETLQHQVDLGWEDDQESGQTSFDVMKFRQWLSLEDTTRLYFYKLKINAMETKKERTMLARGEIVERGQIISSQYSQENQNKF